MPLSEVLSQRPSDQTPIACDLSALDAPEQHERESEALWADRKELREVDGGYALRFPGTIDYAERLLAFVSRERQCCPFLTFQIAFEPEKRGIWLYLGGDERVKAYLSDQLEERAP